MMMIMQMATLISAVRMPLDLLSGNVCLSIDCRGGGKGPFPMAKALGEGSTPFTLYNGEVLERVDL